MHALSTLMVALLLACGDPSGSSAQSPTEDPYSAVVDDGIAIDLRWTNEPLSKYQSYAKGALLGGSHTPGSCLAANTLVTTRMTLKPKPTLWALTEASKAAGCTMTLGGSVLLFRDVEPRWPGPIEVYGTWIGGKADPEGDLQAEAGEAPLTFIRNEALGAVIGIRPRP